MYLKRHYFYVSLVCMVSVILLTASCATLEKKPWGTWTPKEKATFFMASYNFQYDRYMDQVKFAKPNSTQAQILEVKRCVLQEIYGPLTIYVQYAETGILPAGQIAIELESKLLVLLAKIQEA